MQCISLVAITCGTARCITFNCNLIWNSEQNTEDRNYGLFTYEMAHYSIVTQSEPICHTIQYHLLALS